MNRKLLEARPLKYTIDILLQVWFHLMAYVVHVYWLEVSKTDWSCALTLVWFDMQIKWEAHCHVGLNGIFPRWILFYSPHSRARFIAGAAFRDEPVTFCIEKFWIILQHPYGNHINLGLHQHYSCDRLSPIPEYRASERPGSPWARWLTLNKPHCITRGLHVILSPPLGPFILPLSIPFSFHHFHSAIFLFLFGHLSCGTVVSIPRFSNLLSNLLGSVEAFLSFYRVEIEIRVSITSTEMDAGPRAPSP